MPEPILNISAYRFVALPDLPPLREDLYAAAEVRQLKGTVLLASEGINLNLAGTPEAVHGWLAHARRHAPLAPLKAKESHSTTLPFQRLKVKIKREIIRMDCPTVQPQEGRAPALSAAQLERWLAQGHCDNGRPVRLLDTRNAFEVDAGTFKGAIDWRLQKFSDFPAALAQHASELAECTVVSFCTGGIRCEKAALVMQAAGLTHSYQLEDGILGYFEQTGGRAPGWQGQCVVFDERQAVNARLQAAPP